jgi:hypothetical protein
MPAMPPTDPATDHPPDPHPALAARVETLEHEVRRLRDALETHRAAQANEIRTRRLVVVDRSGFERVVVEGGEGHGSLTVRARTDGAGSTKVEVFADDPADGDAGNVGLALGRHGDIVAALEVGGRGRPGLWMLEDE